MSCFAKVICHIRLNFTDLNFGNDAVTAPEKNNYKIEIHNRATVIKNTLQCSPLGLSVPQIN